MSRDLYIPIALVEAMGRATFSRYQFEYAANILLAILILEPENLAHEINQPLEYKLKSLARMPRSRLLKHEWWRVLRSILVKADKLGNEFSEAAFGAIHSRGAGDLEDRIRQLGAEAGPPLTTAGLSQSRVRGIADEFRTLADEASQLAELLLRARKQLDPLP